MTAQVNRWHLTPCLDIAGANETLRRLDVVLNDAVVYDDGAATFSTPITFGADPGIVLSAAASRVVPGTTSLSFRNHANTADNLILTDAGAATFRSTVGGITTLTATTLVGTLSTAAQPNVTSLGTVTSLTSSGQITSPAGAGSATLKSAGIIAVITTDVANAGVGETDLMSYSLPANSLDAVNRTLRVTAWGTLAGNANAKTVKFYWGTINTTVISTAQVAHTTWRAELVITKLGANSQKQFLRGTTNGIDPSNLMDNATSPAQTDTAAITIKLTGTGGASSDIIQKGMVVEFLN